MLPTSRLLTCAALLAGVALTAPSTTSGQATEKEPTTRPQQVDGWGELVDPAGDCKLRRDDGRVTLEVPAGTYDLWPEGNKVNAPRLVQPASGDFTVQVKVVGFGMPEKGSEAPGRDVAFRAAALIIWQDDGNFVRLDRAGMLKKGKPFSQTYYHINQSAKRTAQLSKPLPPDKDVWLRLGRKGDQILAGWSEDGTAWTDYPPQSAKLADKLHAGVAVLNASTAPSSATFEGLELRAAP
jgi:regulation of enolase protein 1 (concanavalin A-like superfamily)